MGVYRIHRGYIHDDCYFRTTGRGGQPMPSIEGIRAGMPRGHRCVFCDGAGSRAPGPAPTDPRLNPESKCIVKTVHGGTDWAIVRASRRDIELGDAMTHAEAVKLCRAKAQEAARKGYALNVYDFSGDTSSRARRKAKAPRRT